jgi:hypothetical protein
VIDEAPDFIDTVEQEQTRVTLDADSQAKAMLELRANAYKSVFHGADPRMLAVVMEDLTKFCRGYDTTYDDIPSRQQHAEGRREVWLRIMDFTRLDPDALFDRYRKPQ